MDRNRGLALGLAAGGVVGGHSVAYALAYPVSALREARLEETGHQGFPLLLVLGFAAAGLTLASMFVLALRREGLVPGPNALFWMQLGIFLALELAERGFDLGAALSDPAVIIGLPVQGALALALAWLARGVIDVVHRRKIVPVSIQRPRPTKVLRPGRIGLPPAPDPHAFGPRRAPPSLCIV